jgi:hypothetical protein
MLTFKRIPMFLFEINDGGGGGAVAPVETAPTQTETEGAGGQGVNDTAKTDGNAQAAAETSPSESELKLQKELDRRTKALANMQKERDILKQQLESTAQKETGKSEPAAKADDVHPALKDAYGNPLEEDEEGRVWDPRTRSYLPPGLLIERYESEQGRSVLEQRIASLENSIAERQRNETEAQHEARIRAERDGLVTTIRSAITDESKNLFKGVDDRLMSKINSRIETGFFQLVNEAEADGTEITGAVMSKLIKQAAKDEFDYTSMGVQRQAAGNQNYRENYPVKTGGQAGSPAVKHVNDRNLTPAQRDAENRKRAERAMSRMPE